MGRRLFWDIFERVAWTFVQGCTSVLMLSGFLDVAAWKAAVVGGVAAVLAFVKSTAASKVGSPATAATLPFGVEAVGTVAGQMAGTVVNEAGEVIGEVTGVVEGTADEALKALDEVEQKLMPRKKAT